MNSKNGKMYFGIKKCKSQLVSTNSFLSFILKRGFCVTYKQNLFFDNILSKSESVFSIKHENERPNLRLNSFTESKQMINKYNINLNFDFI
jgi:hypothetical protein